MNLCRVSLACWLPSTLMFSLRLLLNPKQAVANGSSREGQQARGLPVARRDRS
jgi:hypothetical protein